MLLFAGCAYFNTFHNARKNYREGMVLKAGNQQGQAKAKFDKAIEKSALVITRWPRSRWADDALLLIGLSYYQEGSYTKAIRSFDQLPLAFPRSGLIPEAELYRGLSLLSDNQYGKARLVLDGLKQRSPRLADDAAYHLARSFIDREETQVGIDSLTAFVQRYPRSRFQRDAVKLLADADLKLDRCADAEKWYNRYSRLTQDPKERAQAKLKIALCRYKQGKHEEAVAQARDLLGRYGELDDEANLILGKSLAETGKPVEAVGVWAKVRGMTDFGAEANFRIGKYYEEQGQFEKARAYYDTSRLRRVDSDYGVLAVKRLSLLDAFTQQQAGKRVPAEAAFLLAEVHNLNLGDYDKAMELYQKVHDSFPGTDWSAKALFAKAWILRSVKHDTVVADTLARQVIAESPETEYADESRRWLGLPVPKREKKPEVKAETTRVASDTSMLAGTELPAESLKGDTLAGRLPHEPEMLPPGMRGPEGDRFGEKLDEATGTTGPEPGLLPLPGEEPGTPPETRRGPRPPRTRPKPTEPKSMTEGPPPLPEPETDTTRAESPRPDTTAKKPAPKPMSDVPPKDTAQALPLPAEPEPVAPVPETTHKDTTKAKPALVFAGVHFGTDSADLRAGEADSLELDVRLLKENPAVQVLLVGHCDPRASEEYNIGLGMRRAQAVKKYLVNAGIEARRISVKSRGKADTLSTGPETYWQDRRVEFQVR